MLEDIRYWEASSWKKFIQEELVPLRDLAKFLAKKLSLDTLGDWAKQIGELAERAVSVAESLFGESLSEREIPPDSDLFEVTREFLERGANFTAGHSKYTFFAWSTRKITKNYLEEHYPKLKDPEKFKEVAGILGWSEYWKPLPIEVKLVEDYQVYAYPDYLTLLDIYKQDIYPYLRVSGLPNAKETPGGLICRLNEKLWELIKVRPGLAAGYELPDVSENYRKWSESMLNKALWKDEKDIIRAKSLAELEKDPRCSYLYEFEGLAIKRLYDHKVEAKVSVFEFWDTLMPPMFLGKYEFVLTPDKSKGVIFSRW